MPVDHGQSALRAGRDLEPVGPGRRRELHRLARADPQRRRARSGGDHHAARARATRSPANASRPGFTACSKSRRPRASPRSPISTASRRRSRRDPVHDLARAASLDRRRGGQGARRQAHRVDADPLARGRPQMASRPAMDLGAGRVRRVRSRHQRLLDRDQDLPRRPVRAVGRASASRRMPRRRSPPTSCSPARRPTGRCTASLDWRRTEGEEWTIAVETERRHDASASKTAARG